MYFICVYVFNSFDRRLLSFLTYTHAEKEGERQTHMARYTRTHTHADTDKLPGIVSTDLGQYVFGQAKEQATPAARWL